MHTVKLFTKLHQDNLKMLWDYNVIYDDGSNYPFEAAIIGTNLWGAANFIQGKEKGLKLISRIGSGVDNVNPLIAAKYGIQVKNTPNEPVDSVAELTIGQMIYALRIGCNYADAHDMAISWKKKYGRLLTSCRIGIIGLGRIGSAVATRLIGMGVDKDQIFSYDVDRTAHRTYTSRTSNYIQSVNLMTLLTECDIITVHIPLWDSNYNFLKKYQLSLMKDNAILMNLSRGGIVNEADMMNICHERFNTIYVADVLMDENERDVPRMHNWILTPHIGGSAIESRMAMERAAVTNVREYFDDLDSTAKKEQESPGVSITERA